MENRRNNPQASLDYLNRGLTIAVQLGNDEEKGAILEAIGTSYQLMHKPEDALRNYQEALDVKRRLGDKGGIADALSRMAEIQQKVSSSQQALKSLQEALRLRREIGDKMGIATNLLELANFYEGLGQTDQALNLTKEALPTFREVGDRQNEAVCLNNIGWLYFEKADYEDALLTLSRPSTQARRLGFPADTAEPFTTWEKFFRTGQYNQAMDYYLKALELWRKARDKRGVAFASYGLGRAFQNQGRYGAALTSELTTPSRAGRRSTSPSCGWQKSRVTTATP